ncbi:MAG: ChbG/HpnK family deacetylase [Thermoguttaceae bacterium]
MAPFSPRLVLHADDLGMNAGVSDGILQAFEHGLLTSTSLLANGPDADRALDRWKRLAREQQLALLPSSAARHPLGDDGRPWDLGIHLNLTQGRPLTAGRYPAELLDERGRFPGIFALFRGLWRGAGRFRAALEEELCRQIEFMLDRGVRPTHLNGHQYVEMLPAITEIVPRLLERFAIGVLRVPVERAPFRSLLWGRLSLGAWPSAAVHQIYALRLRARARRGAWPHADAFFGAARSGRIDIRSVRLFLSQPTGFRCAEIALHPGQAVPPQAADGWRDPLAELRPKELQLLLSADLAQCLRQANVRLGRLTDLCRVTNGE